jgi:hypothetical protein
VVQVVAEAEMAHLVLALRVKAMLEVLGVEARLLQAVVVAVLVR